MNYPRPSLYPDWKRWAEALLKVLREQRTTTSTTSSSSGEIGFDDEEGVFFLDNGGVP